MRISKQLQIGKAGEYLVCADLILKGFVAFPSEQGLPFDVLVDNGKKLLKIQVKTTSEPRIVPQRNQDSKAYVFNVKRCGKNGIMRYGESEIDLFALVCLDTMKIGYVVTSKMPETINIRVDSLRGTYYDEKGIKDYRDVVNFEEKATQLEIGKKLGISNTTVSRMLKPDYVPYSSGARYFSDFIRDAEWFENL